MKCECCGFNMKLDLLLQDGKIKYIICHNCMYGLINLSLSKEKFFSLLKNEHTTKEFYLHSDFYNEITGQALQPK